ncbi:MAG: hypothetical protein AAGA75_09200 [Cyanobacteria bacterium P01_E01_bin.6]
MGRVPTPLRSPAPAQCRLIANDLPQSVMTMENIQQAYGKNIRPSLNGKVETPFLC